MKFIEILQEHNIPYRTEGHEHCRPGWIQIDCPWCTPNSKHFRLGYNIAGKYVNCWACGGHRLVDSLTEITGLDNKTVWRLLRDVEFDEKPVAKQRGRLALPAGVGPLLAPHRRYLRNRGYRPAQVARLWGIGGIGLAGTSQSMQWRIFIPIHYRGEVVSWTTRSISEEVKAKYKTAKSDQETISHHELVYGLDYVRGTALVFEGCPSVWRVGPGAVCTFGTQWSWSQFEKLSSLSRVVLCYDPEGTAQKQAEDMVGKLQLMGIDAENQILSHRGQDLSQREVDKLRRKWL